MAMILFPVRARAPLSGDLSNGEQQAVEQLRFTRNIQNERQIVLTQRRVAFLNIEGIRSNKHEDEAQQTSHAH